MSDDLSDLIKNFSNSNIDMNKVNDLLSSLKSTDKSSSSNDSSSSENTSTNNIDINTMLKIKEMMDKINSSHNDKRSNLLLALKPYLRESRQTKLDQYMKLLNMAPLLEMFKNDVYKEELINELEDGVVISVYQQGNFCDLCRGPHVANTKWLKNFKLLSVSGAYWRGDAKTNKAEHKKDSDNSTKSSNDTDSSACINILGIKLYVDDLIILFIIFILYKEKIKDNELIICLLLLLLN